MACSAATASRFRAAAAAELIVFGQENWPNPAGRLDPAAGADTCCRTKERPGRADCVRERAARSGRRQRCARPRRQPRPPRLVSSSLLAAGQNLLPHNWCASGRTPAASLQAATEHRDYQIKRTKVEAVRVRGRDQVHRTDGLARHRGARSWSRGHGRRGLKLPERDGDPASAAAEALHRGRPALKRPGRGRREDRR